MTTFRTALLAATALTLMTGAALAQSNQATSTQTGNGNDTSITQISSVRGHVANSTVTGSDNDVAIDQNSNGGANSGTANVTIGSAVESNANEVNVTQRSFQTQASGAAREEQNASIVVNGNANEVDTVQDFGDDGGPSRNVLTIRLNGNASQQSNGNDVDVTQVNNGNTATVDAWGSSNTLAIVQSGGGNTGSISVDGALPSDQGDNNRVRIEQRFSPLDGFVTGGNMATVNVNGNANNTAQGTLGAQGLTAGDVTQTGAGNEATINVGVRNVSDSNGNIFAASQNGLRNILNASILGNSNQLGVSQTGMDNDVSSTQTGDSNVLAATQNGESNFLTSIQTGNANSATVSQTGNDNVAFNTQTGNGNTMTITQGQ